jgi:hypothetical protein
MPIDSGQVKEINLGDRKKHTKTEFIKSFKPNSNSSQTPPQRAFVLPSKATCSKAARSTQTSSQGFAKGFCDVEFS